MSAPSPLVEQARLAIREGRYDRAEALAREAASAGDPAEAGDPAADALLVSLLRRRGALAEAEGHARRALAVVPDDAVTRAHLGAILAGRGDAAGALEEYAAAVAARPENAVLRNEYANALAAAGRFESAIAQFETAIGLRPGIAEIHNNLANALSGAGRLRDAAACYRKALDLKPDYPEALGNLGVVLQSMRDFDGAMAAFDRAIALRADDALAHTHRGAVLAAQGRLTEAADGHRNALRIAPDLAAAHNNLGIVLKDQGLLAEAREAYEAALAARPDDAGAYSNLLLCLSYDPAVAGDEVLARHRDWAARHARPSGVSFHLDATAAATAAAPLRIGYVSPDFWTHSVACFIEPVLAEHDPAKVEVTCYSDVTEPDETTARLRGLAARWRDVAGLDDAALCERIRADGIQILVDLTGHTGNNRLAVFGRRATPVQVSWIGYPATTGLAAMDYRVTDAWADPPGETDAFHSERLLRLPGGFLCYRPPPDAPAPADPPPDASAPGRPATFGSFNNLSKVTDAAIAVWCDILRRAPDARLLLKSRQLADRGVRDRILGVFARHGVAADRLLLKARLPDRRDHLTLYNEVDVALDTFPYNGTTTTAEALWMGVPVVVLAGALHAGRVGVSLLHRTGCQDWVAASPEDYVDIALRLARARPGRKALRARLAGSPLTDAAAFTHDWEAALAEIWQRRLDAARG